MDKTTLPVWTNTSVGINTSLVATTKNTTDTSTTVTSPVWTTSDGNNTTTVTTKNNSIDKLLGALLNETNDPSKLSAEQVRNYTDQLLSINISELNNHTIAMSAFTVISNLGKVNKSVSFEAEKIDKVNTRLREFLDNYTSEVSLQNKDGKVTISTSELNITVISFKSLQTTDNSSIVFEPLITLNDGTSLTLNITITLPHNLFQETNFNASEKRLQFVGYNRSQLFVPIDGFPKDEDSVDQQRVISASVSGQDTHNLTDSVTIRVMKMKLDVNYSCVFWDSLIDAWSKEGITMSEEDLNSITCSSTHLTSFAILLNVNQNPNPDHEQVLTYLTYIGCGMSMTCLVITLVTYAMFKSLRSEKPGKILLNLCTALLLLNISFLAGTVNVSSYSYGGCLITGMLLHYFVLSSLMWMLVEAVDMYQALVTVFIKYERRFLLKRCILAWGIPVLIVSITSAADSDSYQQKNVTNVCFLTSASTAAFYTSILTPATAIICINIFVFIRIVHIILKPKFQNIHHMNADPVITPSQIRGAFTVMFLLGVTWVFGPLAIGEAQTVFDYLFCICNSLQGFFIFVFRCLVNQEAQLAWLQLFRSGTLKRRRGPIKSRHSDLISKDDHRSSNSNTCDSIASNTTRTTARKSRRCPHQQQEEIYSTNNWYPTLNCVEGDSIQVDKDNAYNYHNNFAFSYKRKLIDSECPICLFYESLTVESVKDLDLSEGLMKTNDNDNTHM